MRITDSKFYNLNKYMLSKRVEFSEIELILNNEEKIISHRPPDLKKKLIDKFVVQGWLKRKQLIEGSSKSIQLYKNRLGLQIQFGHFAMAYYDILKFGTLFHNDEIDIAIFICLEQNISQRLTANIVGYESFIFEYDHYSKFIDLPLAVFELGETQ